jgi:hypothetical protein
LALYAFIVLLAAISARDLMRLGHDLPWLQMHDFQDFYCAGDAVDHHANPYRYEPLHACEHRVSDLPMIREHSAVVVPAPQPPYDFPPFMALAALPFATAKLAYAFAIAAIVFVAAWALSTTGVRFEVAAIAFALPVGFVELDAGQVAPFSFLFLALAGAALAARRDAVAGICAALCVVEPHLGLPVLLAALIFVPRARAAAIATAVVLAAVGVVTVGFPTALQYVLHVLPAHASTELAFPYQYSATYAVRFLGAPAAVAQAIGDVSYVAFMCFGLWLAPRIARALHSRTLLLFLPAAAATIGGPFIHITELIFALPAALVLATLLRGRPRLAAAAALCGLMVPWMMLWGVKKLFAISLLACLVVLLRLGLPPAFITAMLAGIGAVIYGFELHGPVAVVTGPEVATPPDALAQDQWRAFTARVHPSDPRWFAIKLPSWGALAVLLLAAFAGRKR